MFLERELSKTIKRRIPVMRTAIGVVVIRNGKILLVRKKESWILPGGKPEASELDIQCLGREVKEEILPKGELRNIQFYKAFKGLTPHTGDILCVKSYFADIKGELCPSAEINAAEWTSNPEEYNLSDITGKIIISLCEEGYL